jgi:hypothetical protein
MDVTRRQLVSLGAAGATGALIGKVATSESLAAAQPKFGGIHIFAPCQVVDPAPPGFAGFPHTFVLTLWGPDDALTGMGCGFTDPTPDEAPRGGQVRPDYVIGTGMFGCVFSAWGKVGGDVLKGTAIMIYSGMPDEKSGQPFPFEANLSEGSFSATDMNMGMGSELTVRGQGVVVTRI